MPPTHEHFMHIALDEARLALASGEFPVGCVLVADGLVLARGRRRHSQGAHPFELDHAEIVALRSLEARHPETDRTAITAYSTMEPCLMCLATLLLNNVTRIVYAFEDVMGGAGDLDRQHLAPLYRDKEVDLIPGVLRADSLALFQRFFRDPANSYWQGSPLAEHVLSQT
ncbi:MAG: tRNA-specific adenosine deaminase [Deltaproteobacteria bacterium CG_4_10_14_3_um_filter_60_8]|nr:MAG: tRNA-specific adenosine deaminase [Desulfobacterales bacterium CG2_30_60_27]PIP42972.1 MAG: tRNA-specific adenosine deaminase [Deltaproteobacteria bacterium CG23_combo_of_CG06-09_8_20_14_all_60_8]PIY23007.1 MAG: tRNA-specific adenosine deaminase [Deltaproteobacteria bacterium CG_4_10_14_3_um_filter_60_8]